MYLHRAVLLATPTTLALLLTGCPPGETDTSPTTTEPDADPADLEAPPAGKGTQIETPEIAVASGDEIQNCYFYRVSDLAKAAGLADTDGFNLSRVQIAQRDGSHHMNVFKVNTIKGLDPAKGAVEGLNGAGECFKSPNWSDWPLVANSQQDGQLDWQFPEGVANVLLPTDWIMVQTHWVNATSQKTPQEAGKVRINLWHTANDKVEHQMGTLFATKQSIRICQSNPNPQYSGSCQFKSPDPVTIIGANGHFHSRGKQFDMYTWDGVSTEVPPEAERFYRSEAWDDPPMLTSPELLLEVPSNGGVFYTCNFGWSEPDPAVGCSGLDAWDKEKYMTTDENLDCCYTFGPIVEKNEHCNIFVYYYPRTNDVTCF